MFGGGEGHGSKSREKKLLVGEEEEVGGVWLIVLESQLLPLLDLLAAAVAPGKGRGFEAFDFSHAARVAGSTGQTSASVSVFLDISLWIGRVGGS